MKKIFTPQRLIILMLVGVALALDELLFAGIGGGIFIAAALAADRATPSRAGKGFSYPVKSAKKIYAGALVVLSGGYAQPGAAGVGLRSVGVAKRLADNTAGNDGDIAVEVEEGIFLFENSAGGDQITLAEVGQSCYAVDDQTVAKTSNGGTRSVAGYIRDVTSDGVWVEIKNIHSADGDLVAANNLSDVANAATARANIGANKILLELDIENLVGADAKVYRVVSPVNGTITKIYAVLEGAALAGGDATLTSKIGPTAVTDGAITITQAGSAVGDVDSATPSAQNAVVAGNVISITVGGANTDANAKAKVSVLIET